MKMLKLFGIRGGGRFCALIFAIIALSASFGAFAEDAYVYPAAKAASAANGVNVNIGYCMKPVSRIEVDFQFTATPKDVVFGAWGVPGSSAVPQLRTAFWINGGTYQFILSDSTFDSRDTTVAIDTERHVAVIDVLNHKCRLQTVNGELEGNEIVFPACSNTSDWPVSLFGSSKNAAGDGNQHVQAKIYSVKVYENDVLVHDFVPCMKGRDAGFYDEKTGDFRYGKGQCELVCGGDGVKTIPDDGYLQSSGSQYFNTDYKMNPNSRIEVDFQYPEKPSNNFLFGAWSSKSGYGLSALCWNNGGCYSFVLKDNGYAETKSTVSCADTNRFTAVIDVASNVCQIVRNGYVRFEKTVTACTTTAQYPTILFDGYTMDTAKIGNPVSARIYSAKIYEKQQNGTYAIVKEFVPYVKDGMAGFLEKQTGEFKAVDGISYGGSIESDRCSYIENDGATVLNLGYRAKMTSRIEVDYQCLKPSVNSKVIFGAWDGGNLRYTCWNDSNLVKFIFHGKSSGSPQYVSDYKPDALRHTAILDMKNQHIYYLTGSVTNYSKAATADTFNASDVAYPMGVFGTIKNDAGTTWNSSMTSHSRIYSVRIYENDTTLVHEFLPYTDGTTNSLKDVKSGYVATKMSAEQSWPTIYGVGVDGSERWIVEPEDATVNVSGSVTLKAVAAGAVKRYKWTKNGEAVEGGANGELTVQWAEGVRTATYAVTAIYDVAGAEVEGEPATCEVENLPPGLMIIVR